MPLNNALKTLKNWEAWPFPVVYGPLSPVWLKYILSARSAWFFTPSNPGISFGGMIGESKSEIYKLLPDELVPKTICIDPKEDFENIKKKISASGISFPFVVKPDVGEKGLLFRRLENEDQLKLYHGHLFTRYLIQEFVAFDTEVSIFYVRHPARKKGRITGFQKKVPMHVTGTGNKELHELINEHPKSWKWMEELVVRHKENWNKILPEGERYILSYAGNHSRGANFTVLNELITPKMNKTFDDLSVRSNDLFYGRYDIMCSSIEDFRKGINFKILEYNGAGAEPNHFYDSGLKLTEAYKIILWHWKKLYDISMYNRKQGIIPWTYSRGREFMRKSKSFFKKMKIADENLKL